MENKKCPKLEINIKKCPKLTVFREKLEKNGFAYVFSADFTHNMYFQPILHINIMS